MNSKITLFIILSLILSSLQVQAKDIPASKIVIKVNDTNITYAQYKIAFDYHLDLYKKKYGEFPKGWEDALKKVIIDGLILEALILQEAEKTIKITDKEVEQIIKNLPEFKDANGKFNEENYRMALANPNIDWDKIYNKYRRYLLKNKLEAKIKNEVSVSEEEIKKKFSEENEKIRIKYLLIKPEEDKVNVGTITELEIEDYYKKHIKSYQQPEEVRARHILIKPDNDKNKALSKIKDILNEIKAGGNFEELAKKYSACPSKNQGGDLGFFGRGSMVKPFEETAFSLKVGEVSDIVETQFGFHIIKLEERKEAKTIPLSEAKEGIKNIIHNQKVRKEAEKIANQKADEIYSKITQDIEPIAKEYSLEVKESGFFGHHQPIQELGLYPRFAELFSLKQNQITEPIKIPSGFLIAQLIEKRIDNVRYAKEKEIIKQNILKKKRETALEDWYQRKRAKAKIVINLP